MSDDIDVTWATVPTRTVTADGVTYPYRELGPRGGVPLVLLTHLAAVLDNWDPRVVDGLAAMRHVIAFDGRGVGAAGGTTPTTIEGMAADAVTVVHALGYQRVDLLGLSMGGMVAQALVETDPQLVRRLVLAGTGPAGGVGIDEVTRVTLVDTLRATLTRRDPKELLFFTDSPRGRRAAEEFVARLEERTDDRDRTISPGAFVRQLRAVHRWGVRIPQDLSRVTHPVLVVNGDHDRMVPTENSLDLAARLPDSRLVIYPDAGHGALFQYHDEFVAAVAEHLAD